MLNNYLWDRLLYGGFYFTNYLCKEYNKNSVMQLTLIFVILNHNLEKNIKNINEF